MEEPARNARAGRPSAPKRPRPGLAPSPAERCRRKFLEYFPAGFRDDDYVATEREYKWDTHRRWLAQLGEEAFRELLDREDYAEVACRAVRVEQQSRHSMIFSFEKMALRDAVRGEAGARSFAQGLYQFLHGDGPDEERFALWCEVVAALPRRQTRVLTWPLVTVFGFIAQPTRHLFLKPTVTRAAAAAYGFDFDYRSRPNWATYRSLLDYASLIRRDQRDLRPRDMIDLQSFIWVLGSDEYA